MPGSSRWRWSEALPSSPCGLATEATEAETAAIRARVLTKFAHTHTGHARAKAMIAPERMACWLRNKICMRTGNPTTR